MMTRQLLVEHLHIPITFWIRIVRHLLPRQMLTLSNSALNSACSLAGKDAIREDKERKAV